jgi:dimethylamine monooxygenase subunit A
LLPGIKKTCLDDWVEIDKTYLDRYNYKRKLFSEHPAETMQHLPGSEEACFEALYYIADFLPRRYPSMFKKTGVGIDNLITGDCWDLRRESAVWKSHHPLQVMGFLTTEDWFVLQTDAKDQKTRLRAGANCFPAGWKLRERIGHSLWEIHAGKVPLYEQKLSTAMDRFFLRLQPDKPVMRFNYAIDISGELFHIHSHHNLTAESLEKPLSVEQLHLRVERQYLLRLPKTNALVFSIRTYITPIIEVTEDKDIARALRTSVSSYSPEVAAYKNKHLWDSVLMAHIDGITSKS